MQTLCVDDIGTDPNTAINFVRAKVDLTRTGLTADDLRRGRARGARKAQRSGRRVYLRERDRAAGGAASVRRERPARWLRCRRSWPASTRPSNRRSRRSIPRRCPVGAALSYLGTMIREKAYCGTRTHAGAAGRVRRLRHAGLCPQVHHRLQAAAARRDLGDAAVSPQRIRADGLRPSVAGRASARRRSAWAAASSIPVKLGLAQPERGFWLFDTSKDGNHNTGHEFNTDTLGAD